MDLEASSLEFIGHIIGLLEVLVVADADLVIVIVEVMETKAHFVEFELFLDYFTEVNKVGRFFSKSLDVPLEIDFDNNSTVGALFLLFHLFNYKQIIAI